MRVREFISELETLDEMPIPADWDPEQFGPKASFAKMIKYAKERAERMGTGSARVAFLIDYQGRPTILKIARNKKGEAQNEAELNILTDGYAKHLDIMIPLIDYDNVNPVPKWLHLELAQKATPKKLCAAMKCESLDRLIDYAKFKYNYEVPKNYAYLYAGRLDQGQIKARYQEEFKNELRKAGKTEQDIEVFEHYADELATLASLDVILDDFRRAANWGFVNNKPVVIDLGFTTQVYPLYSGGREFPR